MVFELIMFGLVSLLLKGWKFWWFFVFDLRMPKKGLWQRNRKWTFRLEGFNILTVAVTTSAIAVADIMIVCQDPRKELHLKNINNLTSNILCYHQKILAKIILSPNEFLRSMKLTVCRCLLTLSMPCVGGSVIVLILSPYFFLERLSVLLLVWFRKLLFEDCLLFCCRVSNEEAIGVPVRIWRIQIRKTVNHSSFITHLPSFEFTV